MQTERDELTVLLHELGGQPWTFRLHRSDPQYGDLVRRLSSSATFMADAIDELGRLPAAAPERMHCAEVLRTARELAKNVTAGMIEDDFDCLFKEAGLNSIQRRVVARRLGWDGQGGRTLEAAAGGEMTRERVRQLEERVRRVIRETPHLPAVEVALHLLSAKAPLSREAAAEMLVAEGLARHPFDPAGLLNATWLVGRDSWLSLEGGCLYSGEQTAITVSAIKIAARKLVTHNGATTVGTIVDSLDDSSLDVEAVRRLLELEADVRWLDSAREWLFLPTGRNRAENHLRKMLAVAPSLSVSDIREGLRRYDGREVNLPRPIVREFCRCLNWVHVDGERVAAAVPLDYRQVLEKTEESLVNIFRENGPVLDRATAVDLGEQYGLDRTTTGLYLGWSPIIERIVTNRYALRGADVPAGTLEAMRGSSQRTRVQRGYGWTPTGRLWIGYMLSQPVLDSNVIGVPGGLKHELGGRFNLASPNDDLGELATDGTNLWGLSRLLRRYAAEAGDALILEFDISDRIVHGSIGGKELLDPENRTTELAAVEWSQ